MTVPLEIPEDIERRLRSEWSYVPRRALEAVAIEGYRSKAITAEDVARLLGLSSRWEVDELLSRARAYFDYGQDDLAEDVEAIRSARRR